MYTKLSYIAQQIRIVAAVHNREQNIFSIGF